MCEEARKEIYISRQTRNLQQTSNPPCDPRFPLSLTEEVSIYTSKVVWLGWVSDRNKVTEKVLKINQGKDVSDLSTSPGTSSLPLTSRSDRFLAKIGKQG